MGAVGSSQVHSGEVVEVEVEVVVGASAENEVEVDVEAGIGGAKRAAGIEAHP